MIPPMTAMTAMSTPTTTSIITHPLKGLEHDNTVSANDTHSDSDAFAAGFFFDGFVQNDVQEDLLRREEC
jgi:hypothetical protein